MVTGRHPLLATAALSAMSLWLTRSEIVRAQSTQEAETPAPATPPIPQNDPSPGRREAQDRFRHAMELFDLGNYNAALLELRRAYELAPTYKLFYNIAVIHVRRGDFASALSAFGRYLGEGAQQLSEDRRTEVERKIAELKGRVARVVVSVNLPGAEIFVDDKMVGTAPLNGPIVMNVGSRHISARAPAWFSATRVIELSGGDEKNIALELEARDSHGKPIADSPRPIPWIGWVATATLAGGAIFSGFHALSAQREYESLLGRDTTRSALDSANDKALHWSIATDVLGALSLAMGGYSLYLTLRAPPAESRGTTTAQGNLTLRVAPMGATLQGRF